MKQQYDDAVVGAGIIGLAHAYYLAARGRRVIVLERRPRAGGASVRNFGMIWPIGQPAGALYELARRSRELWLNVLQAADLWYEQTGSLHLAYCDDEAQVLREFIAAAPANGYECSWLTPSQALTKSPAIKPDHLCGAMWSAIEICVDPRASLARLPAWLHTEYGVEFAFDCAATVYDNGYVIGGGREFLANNLYVCAGEDLQTLFPIILQNSGLMRCKLQMMRSQPTGDGWRVGPMLAAGLTLRHYNSFQACPSLPALKERFAAELPEYVRYGIHVLVSQNGLGELTLGDSHEYGAEITPFDKPEIDELVLRYLATFFHAPDLQIRSRWHGVYVKHPTAPYFIARPSADVTIITGVGGAGMTLSFGLAEQVVKENLGES